MPKIISLTSIIILLGSCLCWGQSLTQIADSIIPSTTAYLAIRTAEAAAYAAARPDGNLSDPQIEVEHLWGAGSLGNKFTLSVSQGFEWPGVYKARSKAAEAACRAASAQAIASTYELRQQLRQQLLDVAYQNHMIQLLDSLLDNSTQRVKACERAFTDGQSTIIELRKAQLEQLSITNRRSRTVAARDELLATLNSLTAPCDIRPIAYTLALPNDTTILPLEEYIERATSHDPVLASLIALASQQEAATEVARQERLPGFSLGYVYNREMGETYNGLSASLTLPIFSQRHRVQAARVAHENAIAQAAANADATLATIATLRQSAIEQKQHCQAYQAILDNDDLSRLLLRSHLGGQIDLPTYLAEIAVLIEARIESLDAHYALQSTLIKLNKY